MTGKHTPGPWHLFRNEVNNSDGLTVANIVQFVPAYRDVSNANACLIAAAPELLDALRQCQSALAMMVAPDAIKSTSVLHAFAQVTAAEVVARAVIAKASPQSLATEER